MREGGREKKDGKATTTCRVAVYTCACGFTHVHIHNSSHVEAWHKAQGTDNTEHTLIYTPALYMYIHMYINSCHLLKLGIVLVIQKQ